MNTLTTRIAELPPVPTLFCLIALVLAATFVAGAIYICYQELQQETLAITTEQKQKVTNKIKERKNKNTSDNKDNADNKKQKTGTKNTKDKTPPEPQTTHKQTITNSITTCLLRSALALITAFIFIALIIIIF